MMGRGRIRLLPVTGGEGRIVYSFPEDGSRKVTRITEARGLGDDGQYQLHDLFVSKFQGKSDDGRLIAELEPTGEKPGFASAPFEQGLQDSIHLTGGFWTK